MAGELVKAIRRVARPVVPLPARGRVLRRGVGPRGGAPSPAWVTYTQQLSGKYRVEGAALQYELYVGQDANPDFAAAPAAVSATLPFDYALAAPPSGTREYRLVCRVRNVYGLLSQNVYIRNIILSNTGAQEASDPSGPEGVALTETNELYLIVQAVYYAIHDGDNKADVWDVYAKVGVDPVPGVDVPISINMTSGYVDVLWYKLGPYNYGETVHVIVRCRRDSDSNQVDDGNVTVYTETLSSEPAYPAHGRGLGS